MAYMVGSLKVRDFFKVIRVDGSILLKQILKKKYKMSWTDFVWLGRRKIEGLF
jgi:hypothetical protein